MAAVKVRLAEYLASMRAATTPDALQAAITAPFPHKFRGKVWDQICDVRIEAGLRICDAHPFGHFVPRFSAGRRRVLTVCGVEYRVGRGQNSAGVRWVWHAAGEFIRDVLMAHNFSRRAAYIIVDGDWSTYPHRCLDTIEKAVAGKIPDPTLNRLKFGHMGSGPIQYTVAANDADHGDRRATRKCRCGGTLFDWGAGYSHGFNFVSWRCNGCPRVFESWHDDDGFRRVRQGARQLARKEIEQADAADIIAGKAGCAVSEVRP